MTLHLQTLGPIAVSHDDDAPLPRDLFWKKPLSLLVYLACSPPRGRTREHLAELLWPRGKAGQSLNQALVPIRSVLGDDLDTTDEAIIRLRPGSVRMDLEELNRLAAEERWAEASRLVVGEFCEGLAIKGLPDFEEWLSARRRHWRQVSADALIRQAEQLLDGADTAAALESARRARGFDDLSERAIRVTMRALALAGQRAEAIREYEDATHHLREVLGIEPAEETRALAARLRNQSPAVPARAAPVKSEASRRAPLVGRAPALARLLETWTGCQRESRAAVMVIEGEAGCGTTRLAEEVVARARLDGAVVAAVHLVEADRSTPHSVLSGLARGGLLPARGLVAANPAALGSLAGILPDWAERFPARPEQTMAVGEAFREVVRAAADEQPVVLLVDDAQWADEASLLNLEALLRDYPGSRILLLLTLEPQPGRIEIDRIRARLGRDLAGTAITIGPLRLDEVRELSRWALPDLEEAQVDRLTRRVFADSAGIAFLVVELLHAVALGLELGQGAEAWPAPFQTLTDTLPGDLSDSVVAAIRVGFRRLSQDAQRLAITTAVLGEAVPVGTLTAATGLAAEPFHAALHELEWQRWITVDGRGCSFVARIARQVVERDMVTSGQKARILELRPMA